MRGGQAVGQPGQLGGQRRRRRDIQAAIAHLLHRGEELPAGLGEPPADQHGHGEPGQSRDGDQLQHDLTVPGVAHHDHGDAADPGDGRHHGHARDEREHRADGMARERAQRDDPDDRGDGPDNGRGDEDVDQVGNLHAWHDVAGRREDTRRSKGHQAASGS
jgi:hypothetical protein